MIFLNESMVNSIIVESWSYDELMYHTGMIDSTIDMQIQEGYVQDDIITEGFVDTVTSIFNKIREKIQQFIKWVSDKFKEIKNKFIKSKNKKNTDDVKTDVKKNVVVYSINDDEMEKCIDIALKRIQSLNDIFYDFVQISGSSNEILSKINDLTDTVNDIIKDQPKPPQFIEMVNKVQKLLTADEFTKYQDELLSDLNRLSNKSSTITSKNDNLVKMLRTIRLYKFSAESKELANSIYKFAEKVSQAATQNIRYSSACIDILIKVTQSAGSNTFN